MQAEKQKGDVHDGHPPHCMEIYSIINTSSNVFDTVLGLRTTKFRQKHTGSPKYAIWNIHILTECHFLQYLCPYLQFTSMRPTNWWLRFVITVSGLQVISLCHTITMGIIAFSIVAYSYRGCYKLRRIGMKPCCSIQETIYTSRNQFQKVWTFLFPKLSSYNKDELFDENSVPTWECLLGLSMYPTGSE